MHNVALLASFWGVGAVYSGQAGREFTRSAYYYKMKNTHKVGGRNAVLNNGIAKIEGAGQMLVTLFERTNWAKMASAAKNAGLDSVAKKFGAAAQLPVGAALPLSVFDELQREWRDWLVAGFRKPLAPVANDLITELREALDALLGQADLGEVDEETQPIVMRAKSAVMRAEREESSLISGAKAVIACWETGDLAGAVNRLAGAVRNVEGKK